MFLSFLGYNKMGGDKIFVLTKFTPAGATLWKKDLTSKTSDNLSFGNIVYN